MKYLVILSAMIVFIVPNMAVAQNADTAQPTQKKAQRLPQPKVKKFKKHYAEIDTGIFLQDGANNAEYTRMVRAIATDVFAENDRDDLDASNADAGLKAQEYFRLAYGYHMNQQISFELATTGVAIENIFIFDAKNENSLRNSFNDVSYYSINILEVAGIYYIPFRDAFKFTLRGGFGFYKWLSETSQPLAEEEAGQKYSGSIVVLGVGADINDVHVEYRLYDLSYIEVYKGQKYQLYDNVGVLTVGYKIRF
ncbi:MAG: hypothetical protein K0U45_02585 [Alphaproteobacteria bacterium]|nr:hypothetical protein [Alphaproteobacteria bacterium]